MDAKTKAGFFISISSCPPFKPIIWDMNISTLFGFVIALFVLWAGVISHSAKPTIFLDPHALILVIGGTLAAGLIAFPFTKFRDLLSFLIMGVLYPSKKVHAKVLEEILVFAGLSHELQSEERPTCHPFLAEGYRLITKNSLSIGEFKAILHQRSQSFKERYSSDARTLNALAKFPPAFGLLGATTGMIAMMTNLGTSGQDSIGPAMAIALVATFWGIGVANLVLLPLADHAAKLANDDAQLRTMMITGLLLLHQNASPTVMFETLIGYLPMKERYQSKWRKLVSAVDLEVEARERTQLRLVEMDGRKKTSKVASGSDV